MYKKNIKLNYDLLFFACDIRERCLTLQHKINKKSCNWSVFIYNVFFCKLWKLLKSLHKKYLL